jgi:hypothetical protein
MTTQSRRRFLSALSATPAVALAGGTAANVIATGLVKAAEVDPIFAVIKRHWHAVRIHQLAGERFRELNAQEPQMPDFETVEERVAWVNALHSRPSLRNRAYDLWNETGKHLTALTDELLQVAPTTVAGVTAALAHWADVADDETADRDFERTREFIEHMAESMRAIISNPVV